MAKFPKRQVNAPTAPAKKIEKTVTFCNHCQYAKTYRENKPDTCNWLMVCDYVDNFGRQPENVPFILRKGQDKNFNLNAIPDNCPLEDFTEQTVKPPRPPKPEPVFYTVTVINGEGSGEYAEGEIVTITADDPPVDKVFYRWETTDVIVFDDETSEETSFKMPAFNVKITAIFEDV
jgi:hypothetical protein